MILPKRDDLEDGPDPSKDQHEEIQRLMANAPPIAEIDFAKDGSDEIQRFLDAEPFYYEEDPHEGAEGIHFLLINAHLAKPSEFSAILRRMPHVVEWSSSEEERGKSASTWSPLEMAIAESEIKIHEIAASALSGILAAAPLSAREESQLDYPHATLNVSREEDLIELCRLLPDLPLEGFGMFSIDVKRCAINAAELIASLASSRHRAYHLSFRGCDFRWETLDHHSFEGWAAISARIVSQEPLDIDTFYAFKAATPHINLRVDLLPNMLEILRDPRAETMLNLCQTTFV